MFPNLSADLDILAYRKATVFAPSAIDGVSSLNLTPQALDAFAIAVINQSQGNPNFYDNLPALFQAGALEQTKAGLAGAGIVAGARALVIS